MRRSLSILLAIVGSLVVPALASATPVAETQESCTGEAVGPVSVEAAADSADAGHVTICNDDTDFPLEGNITARGDASQSCGSVSIDGDPENPYLDFDQDGAGNLDGYAALEGDAGDPIPVGVEESEEGDYRADCIAD